MVARASVNRGLVPGAMLAGRYRLIRQIAHGGMGLVFEAMHERLEQRVAVKIPHPAFAGDPKTLKLFEREARAVARLKSRHIVRVHDVDVTAAGVPFIVLEFLEGEDLEEAIASCALPVPELVEVALEVCDGLEVAHAAGILHRDLKPANLFRVNEGGEWVVRIVDFGVSKIIDETTRLTFSEVLGTPEYSAPEQLRANAKVGPGVDIWALGMILYRGLAGQSPFGPAPQETHPAAVNARLVATLTVPLVPLEFVRPDLPLDLTAAVMRALEREPEKRFASVGEMAEALSPFGRHAALGAIAAPVARETPPPPPPLAASPPSAPLPPHAPSGSSALPVAIAFLIGVVAAVGAAKLVASRIRSKDMPVVVAPADSARVTSASGAPPALPEAAPSSAASSPPVVPASPIAPSSSVPPSVVAPASSGAASAPGSAPSSPAPSHSAHGNPRKPEASDGHPFYL